MAQVISLKDASAKLHILPQSLPPRGLSRAQAAAYVGIGATLFDEMVADGRMPEPKLINQRVIWDKIEVDESFAALPTRRIQNPFDAPSNENQHA